MTHTLHHIRDCLWHSALTVLSAGARATVALALAVDAYHRHTS